jgi:UDP-N-acetylglucosamine--N-acetylmuramyl-(pentapeptide) pyrophosphoryl-undecaprenol N-acetylglucosamine transferase
MPEQREPVCLIAAGGTAGHLLPALAVAEALVARGARVTFAGSPARLEARLVPEAGFEFDPFQVSGLPRRPGLAFLRAFGQAVGAVRACGRILAARRPNVVLGAGGYVSGPMVLAAARRRIPTALLEADAHLGLANRLAAPLAKRVFLSFPIAGRTGWKYRVTGRPIPARSQPVEPDAARRRFDLPENGPVLLVFGGSQGARTLNELAVEAFADDGPVVLHLAGERDYPGLRDRVGRPGYRLLPFTDDFGAALGAADLALARAGGSVWELAAAGVPAVLVPYPSATADHQTLNARHFTQGGGAILVPESELPAVPTLVRSLLADPARLGEMRAAMRRLARPGAADVIAEELIALAST